MDKTEIKQWLHAYNPDLGEVDDPTFQEALDRAKADPELSQWMKDEQSFDRVFSDALTDIETPSGIKDDLIDKMNRIVSEEVRAAQQDVKSTVTREKTVSFTRYWKRTVPIAMAAGFLIALSLLFVSNRQKQIKQGIQVAYDNEFVEAVAMHTVSYSRFQYKDEDVGELKSWLTSHEYPHFDQLPTTLENLKGLGCLTFTYEGRTVSKICFKGDKVYHLFVANRSDFPPSPELSAPAFYDLPKNHSSTTWIDDEHLYLLSVKGKKEELDPFL